MQGWWIDNADPPRDIEDAAGIARWIKNLPKPCGIFACCDSWARVVARYCRVAEVRIPDEIALLGVDNDTIECELTSPPLSSVAVPWRTLGQEAADLVYRALAGMPITGKPYVTHSEHDTPFVAPGTELSFDVYSGNLWINFHDRFSIQDNSFVDPTYAGTGDYQLLQNVLGASFVWDLDRIMLKWGFDYNDHQALTGI